MRSGHLAYQPSLDGVRALAVAAVLAFHGGDALAALAYVANWWLMDRGGDYFAATAAPSPLQHTWSLGIEEQFYLLWPLIVAGLLAWWGRRRGVIGLLVGCVV